MWWSSFINFFPAKVEKYVNYYSTIKYIKYIKKFALYVRVNFFGQGMS